MKINIHHQVKILSRDVNGKNMLLVNEEGMTLAESTSGYDTGRL